MSYKYWLLILLLGFGWGSSFFFNEILLRELGPMMVALGRVGLGALGCWIWLVLVRENIRVSRRQIGILAIFGLFQYALPLSIYPLTQQYITSSAAGVVNAMTPVMVVLVSHFWPQGERATWAKSLGVAFGFTGIVIIASPAFQGQGQSDPLALCLTILAPLCYGIAMNLVRLLDGLSRTVMTAWSATLGTVMVAPLAFWLEGVPVITRLETWLSLAMIGFVLTSAAFILMFWLIPRVGGTTASTITFIAPIASIWLGVAVLDEQILPVQALGMAVIFLGLLCIDGRIFRRWRQNQPSG